MSQNTSINWDAYPNFTEDEFRCKCGCGRAVINVENRPFPLNRMMSPVFMLLFLTESRMFVRRMTKYPG